MPKARKKRLKLEQRIALARRYHAGETPKVLAEAYGVSRRQVTRVATEQRGEGKEVRDPSIAVSFRAAQSELAAFDAEWLARGFTTRSQALQAVIRARCGLLDVMRADLGVFSEALRQVQDLSDGARVLAKAVQRGKLEFAPQDRDLLVKLLDVAQGTHRELAALKSAVHARRGAGWRPAHDVSVVGDGEACETGSVRHASDPVQSAVQPHGGLDVHVTQAAAAPHNKSIEHV